MMKLKPIVNAIQESSLSRVTDHMKKHDCGTITAFRSEYSKSDNKKRNMKLKAMLDSKGYNLTNVDGSFIENFGTPKAVEIKEDVFFVVDVNDTGNLRADLMKLGEAFEQDSILFIPKMSEQRNSKSGTFTGGSVLIGITHNEDAYVKYHEEKPYNDIHYGKEVEFMTKVNGRPFNFSSAFTESVVKESYFRKANWFGKLACKTVADRDWREINLNEEL